VIASQIDPNCHEQCTAQEARKAQTAADSSRSKMEIDGQNAEQVPQAEMTSENYYFDSYSHFGKSSCLHLCRGSLQQQTPPAPADAAHSSRRAAQLLRA
jgi:hypothetical protein